MMCAVILHDILSKSWPTTLCVEYCHLILQIRKIRYQRGSLDSQHWHSGLVISGWVLRSLPADWYSIWHKVGSNGY